MKTFKEIIIAESAPKQIKADYVVIHFPNSYEGSVTPLTKAQVKDYFSEDMGFDPDDEIPEILGLKPSQSWEGSDIQVIRIK